MAESLETRQQKKVLRALVRLQASLEADRKIEALLAKQLELGTSAIVPQLETTLDEILTGKSV